MNTAMPRRSNSRAVRVTLSAIGIFVITLFVFFGMLMLHAPANPLMQCQRATNQCELTVTQQNHTQKVPLAVSSLRGARVFNPTNTKSQADSSVNEYRVVLYSGPTNYFVAGYGSSSAAEAARKKINDFIVNKNQAELVLTKNQDSMATAAWSVLVVMSLVVIGMLVSACRKPNSPS